MAYQIDAPIPMRDQNMTHHHIAVDTTTGEITKVIGGVDPDTFVQRTGGITRPDTEIARGQAANAAERAHATAYNKQRMAETAIEFAKRLRALKGGPMSDDQAELEEIYKMIQELLLQLGIAGGLEGLETDAPTCTKETTDAHRGKPGMSVDSALQKIRQDQQQRDAFLARQKERVAVVYHGAPDPIGNQRPNPRDLNQYAAWVKARGRERGR